MLPTIHTTGDCVLVSGKYRRGKGIKVGDLVDFKSPLEEGVACVKRVVGMPGDIVARCAGGAQFGGGRRERKGDVGGEEEGEGDDKATMLCQVPRGHVWLEGDNLTESRDSRMYGPVPMGLIRGKVVARWWPWGEGWRLKGAGFGVRKVVEEKEEDGRT
ncbi:MAG: hypothetical protein Q9167_003009 [Letrouitia subvulpina]